ncbi:ABC transporter substrate-binding protein [Anaerotignum sp. MSJ-24]|uniref:ABC transporter substrate-binding protein n=1 Tax=Anaerotignum sp. MSJ-24 TaxID=2841521 RepID=UPI001C1086BC|nr:ABC transporter substrate-binding protein [Anaerotignum sp. MSJ-24]MBU5464718.1 ABC transporter substrate-binding protein [Anaerotignum sp. MSJ-24]
MKSNFKITKLVALLLAMIFAMSAMTGCSSSSNTTETKAEDTNDDSTASETQVVIDSIGREVEIPDPVTKAVVANAYNTEIINAIDALDCVIGVDYNIYQDKESWKNKFTEDMVIGQSQKELNYEKIIELAPEVLILTGNGTYEEAEQQLEPFGIKVVVCDAYYTDQFEKSCDLLGQVFGKEENADELKHYFMDKLDYINKQLEGVEKKTLYFEYRREGNTTIPGNFFYYMVEYAGADNVFKDSQNVEVESEAVIAANPEYIVKVSAPDVYSSYYPPTLEEHQAIKEELISRPGWDEIDAVKNDNILLLSHYVHGGASKLVGCMYIAKFLYPDLLPDLHPEEVFRDWLEKYQKLDYIEGHTYPAYTFED